MNLLESMMEPCVTLIPASVSDCAFGQDMTWIDGASFDAVIIKQSTPEERVAEKQGVAEGFTVVTQKGFGLAYHDVFRRMTDGMIFRVTSHQLDAEAPAASTVQIGKVTAERWELPQ